MRTIRGRRQCRGIRIPAVHAQRTVWQFNHIRHNTGQVSRHICHDTTQVSSRLIVFLCGAGLLRRERGKDGCQLARAQQGSIALQCGIGRPTRGGVVGALVQQTLQAGVQNKAVCCRAFIRRKNCGKMICVEGLYCKRPTNIWRLPKYFIFWIFFFLRARVCRPLLRLCRPFMIFEGCLDSNPECCRSKLARYRLSHPSLYLATHPFRNIDHPPPLVRGEDTLAGWRGGGGSIFRRRRKLLCTLYM
jgi:hypothetical protein